MTITPFLMAFTPEAYVHLSEDKKTLTFYYDTLRADRDGTTWGIRDTDDDYDWTAKLINPNTIVLTAVFDASFRDFRPTTTAGWFTGLLSLRSIEGFELLLSAKLQNATISLSAMPINRRCGLLFGKVSPPFPTIIHWLSAKTREWKTRDVAKCVL